MIKIEEKENLVRKRGKRWDSFHIVKFNKMLFVLQLQCLDVSDVSATDSVEFSRKKKKKWNDSKL